MDQQHAMLNNTSYNLAEIWQYSINNAGGTAGVGGGINESGLGLGLKRGQHFGDKLSDNDPVSFGQRRGGAAHCGGLKKRRDLDDGLNKVVSTSGAAATSNCNNSDGDGKRMKMTENYKDDNNRESNAESAEPSSGKHVEQKTKKPPEPPKDYIHVRARRGQATDSHSLAERARREKISERMKILQDLVPGCNKVIGKALVLDEIINYIQSLQRQVEFLSMKLEAVNSRINPGIEFGQQYDNTGMAFASQPTREYNRGTSPEWLHMQVGGGFEKPT